MHSRWPQWRHTWHGCHCSIRKHSEIVPTQRHASRMHISRGSSMRRALCRLLLYSSVMPWLQARLTQPFHCSPLDNRSVELLVRKLLTDLCYWRLLWLIRLVWRHKGHLTWPLCNHFWSQQWNDNLKLPLRLRNYRENGIGCLINVLWL